MVDVLKETYGYCLLFFCFCLGCELSVTERTKGESIDNMTVPFTLCQRVSLSLKGLRDN